MRRTQPESQVNPVGTRHRAFQMVAAVAVAGLGLTTNACSATTGSDAGTSSPKQAAEPVPSGDASPKPAPTDAAGTSGATSGGTAGATLGEGTPQGAETSPTGTPSDAPAKVAGPARAVGEGRGVEVVVLRGHELLGSESRMIDTYVAALGRGGLASSRVDAPGSQREAALRRWLDTIDPEARAGLPSDVAMGDAAVVIVTRIEAPVRRVARGANAFGVLLRGPSPELLWMNLDGAGQNTMGEDVKLILPLLEGVPGAVAPAAAGNPQAQVQP